MSRSIWILGVLVSLVPLASRPQEARLAGEAARSTIDVGVVVGDLDRSIDFYTKVLGFDEVPGFPVPEDFCRKVGLTNGSALEIRVLTLGSGPSATRLKLMSLPETKPQKPDNRFIHSELGYSYLTLQLTTLGPVRKRLEASGEKPVAQSPVPLPGAGPDGAHLLMVRDPDGNLIELIGALE